jgi:hypothetical protein
MASERSASAPSMASSAPRLLRPKASMNSAAKKAMTR